MTEKQKKIALIVGTIIIGLIILLSSRKSVAGTTIVNQESAPPINVSIPSFNIPARSPIAINIPALPSASPYDYNAISPCMCNGAAVAQLQMPSITFVTNEGNSGPNIYDYSQSQQEFTVSAKTGNYYTVGPLAGTYA
jgi:hypothetical protein